MEMKRSLKGKKILFFSPAFFGYELEIQRKMEYLGAIVDFYDEKSISRPIFKALLKISPWLFRHHSHQYFEDISTTNKAKNYDYVFIIKCDMISWEILQFMKSTFINAKFCLYLWDSLKNMPDISKKLTLFDNVFSFDRYDTMSHTSIRFRPLFFIDEYMRKVSSSKEEGHKYDICFLGTVHSDRYRIIREIREYCENRGYSHYFHMYLQSRFVYWFYKFTKRGFYDTKEDDFCYEKLNFVQICNLIEDSRVVLDVQHPKQTGLTMRTIEMIGMRKKIITTNRDIVNYDFYNPNNVLVVSRERVNVSEDFLEKCYEPLKQDVYLKYSLENWILEILTG